MDAQRPARDVDGERKAAVGRGRVTGCRFKWLAPEALSARQLTSFSDMWALGVTGTELFGVLEPYGPLPASHVLPMFKGRY